MPSNPQAKFSAHLSGRGKFIELATAAEVAGPERLCPGRDEVIADLLHGYTTLGSCTLIGVQECGSRQVMDGTGRMIITRRFRAGSCVLGLNVAGYSTPELVSARCSYAGLGDWLRSPTQINLTNEALLIRHPTQPPSLVDFCVLANKTHVDLRVASTLKWSPSGWHSASGDVPQLLIESTGAASLEWFLNTACRFENFFSLCVGTSVLLRTVQLTNSAGREGWLVYPHLGRVEKPDPQAQIRCNDSDLAGSMAAWLTTSERLRPIENLIFGTIRNTSMFVETEFLSLAQALESFHRLTHATTLAESLTFKRALKVLLKAIDSSGANAALARRLADGVRYANEPSFKNRVESLLALLPSHHVLALLGDPTAFEQTLRQTRNFFTHPGTTRQSHVLGDAKAIFLFNQRLHALLRLLMLVSVGFSEDTVFEMVQYQSSRWS
jgi:hypothetical protein